MESVSLFCGMMSQVWLMSHPRQISVEQILSFATSFACQSYIHPLSVHCNQPLRNAVIIIKRWPNHSLSCLWNQLISFVSAFILNSWIQLHFFQFILPLYVLFRYFKVTSINEIHSQWIYHMWLLSDFTRCHFEASLSSNYFLQSLSHDSSEICASWPYSV